MTAWEHIKDFYKTNFGINEWVVELYANLDILSLCVSGAGNETIVQMSGLDLDDVVEILLNTFNFEGWKQDLPINPYKIYIDTVEAVSVDVENRFKRSLASNLYMYTSMSTNIDSSKVYEMCKTMAEIEERIADEWI